MSKKQLKALITALQVLLICMLFLPVGMETAAKSALQKMALSVFGLMRRYAGMGFSNDALVFTIIACCLPVLITVFLFALKGRSDFGTAACLGALYTLCAACFFSAAKNQMVDVVSMTGVHYIIILISIIAMLLSIYGFIRFSKIKKK
jgi:hypothetical protein